MARLSNDVVRCTNGSCPQRRTCARANQPLGESSPAAVAEKAARKKAGVAEPITMRRFEPDRAGGFDCSRWIEWAPPRGTIDTGICPLAAPRCATVDCPRRPVCALANEPGLTGRLEGYEGGDACTAYVEWRTE